eukprot:5696964-Alexandrium_andersonii.AAC.1
MPPGEGGACATVHRRSEQSVTSVCCSCKAAPHATTYPGCVPERPTRPPESNSGRCARPKPEL